MNRCEMCGTEIHGIADVCSAHAMTSEQLVELGRRISQVQRDFYLEIWPDLKRDEAS